MTEGKLESGLSQILKRLSGVRVVDVGLLQPHVEVLQKRLVSFDGLVQTLQLSAGGVAIGKRVVPLGNRRLAFPAKLVKLGLQFPKLFLGLKTIACEGVSLSC